MSSAAHMEIALQIIGKKVKMLCQRFCTSSDSSSSFSSSPSTTNASLVDALRTIAGPDAAAAAASPAVGRMACIGRVFSGLSASSRLGDLTRLTVDESAAACLRVATLPCPPHKPDPPSPLEGPAVAELTLHVRLLVLGVWVPASSATAPPRLLKIVSEAENIRELMSEAFCTTFCARFCGRSSEGFVIACSSSLDD